MKKSIKALAALASIAAITTGAQAQPFPDNIDENEPAATTASVSTGGSKYNVVDDETLNTFSISATVNQAAFVRANATTTSESFEEKFVGKRVSNREVLTAMAPLLNEGKINGYTLVWLIPGDGADVEDGELFAYNRNAPVATRFVAVPEGFLAVAVGDSAEAVKGSVRLKDGEVVPGSEKEDVTVFANVESLIGGYAEAFGVMNGKVSLKFLKVPNADPVPTFSSSLRGTLAAVTIPTE